MTERIRQWRIKLDELKSIQVSVTNKWLAEPRRSNINGIVVPYSMNVKYARIILDAILRWKGYVTKKKNKLDLKRKQYPWLIRKSSKLSISNKMLIYNQIYLLCYWTVNILCENWRGSSHLLSCNVWWKAEYNVRENCGYVCCIHSSKLKMINKRLNGHFS